MFWRVLELANKAMSSGVGAQPMAAQSRYRCAATLRGHTNFARRRRQFEPRVDRVDAATGAGLVRRWPAERLRRVRVARQHAQSVGRFERQVPPHAERAHGLGAAPASIRTAEPKHNDDIWVAYLDSIAPFKEFNADLVNVRGSRQNDARVSVAVSRQHGLGWF